MLLAATAASLVPTVCRTYRYGFDNGMIPLLMCSLVIFAGCAFEFGAARRHRKRR